MTNQTKTPKEKAPKKRASKYEKKLNIKKGKFKATIKALVKDK